MIDISKSVTVDATIRPGDPEAAAKFRELFAAFFRETATGVSTEHARYNFRDQLSRVRNLYYDTNMWAGSLLAAAALRAGVTSDTLKVDYAPVRDDRGRPVGHRITVYGRGAPGAPDPGGFDYLVGMYEARSSRRQSEADRGSDLVVATSFLLSRQVTDYDKAESPPEPEVTTPPADNPPIL